MAKIYLAARYSRLREVNRLATFLSETHGHTITSRWSLKDAHLLPGELSKQAADAERQRFALEDCFDLRACDWCISLMEEPRNNSRGGRHVEFGYALALGKRLTIIGPRETVFHHLPQVEHFEDVRRFLLSLEVVNDGSN